MGTSDQGPALSCHASLRRPPCGRRPPLDSASPPTYLICSCLSHRQLLGVVHLRPLPITSTPAFHSISSSAMSSSSSSPILSQPSARRLRLLPAGASGGGVHTYFSLGVPLSSVTDLQGDVGDRASAREPAPLALRAQWRRCCDKRVRLPGSAACATASDVPEMFHLFNTARVQTEREPPLTWCLFAASSRAQPPCSHRACSQRQCTEHTLEIFSEQRGL